MLCSFSTHGLNLFWDRSSTFFSLYCFTFKRTTLTFWTILKPEHPLTSILLNAKLKTLPCNAWDTLHSLWKFTFSTKSNVKNDNKRSFASKLGPYHFLIEQTVSHKKYFPHVYDLTNNSINDYIYRDAFVNLPILRSLHLNRNNISIVHDRAFKYLNSLRELELNDNQITVVKRDNFHGLSNLLRLDLSNNLISMIGERSFVEMPVLAELNLDQNQIEYISERALDGMRNLRKLLLSENQLVTLSSDFLVGAPGVNFLDLRKNVLKTMTFDSIKPIVFNLYSTDSQFYLNGEYLNSHIFFFFFRKIVKFII